MIILPWQDGSFDQVKVLTNMLHGELHEINLMMHNEHSASRTGVDQGADIGVNFPK